MKQNWFLIFFIFETGFLCSDNVPLFVKWFDDTRYLSCQENKQNSLGTTVTIFETSNNRSLIIEIPLKNCRCESVAESGTQKYFLIPCDSVKKFRYTNNAKYYIFDPTNSALYLLKLNDVADPLIQHASWIGKNDSLIGIVGNNIYYAESVKKYINDGLRAIEQITTDGNSDIYNGFPDWIYEEEIINNDNMYWANTNGNLLLYSRIDNTNVPQITVSLNDTTSGVKQKIHYPHPGENIPTIQMIVVNLKNKMKWKLKPPHDMTKNEGLIFYSAKWVKSQDEVSLTWGNRFQNHLFHIYYFFTRGDISNDLVNNELILKAGFEMYEYRIKDGWVDEIMRKNILIDAEGHYAYFSAPLFSPIYEIPIDAEPSEQQVEHKNSYMRIYQSDLTHIFMEVNLVLSILGDWEVSQLVCVNDNYLYFMSNENNSFSQNLYYIEKRIDLNNDNNNSTKRPGSVYYSLMATQKTHCITCDIEGNTQCKFASVSPNEACSNIFITCTNEHGDDIKALYSYNNIEGHKTIIYSSSNNEASIRSVSESNLTKNCSLIYNQDRQGIRVCETSKNKPSEDIVDSTPTTLKPLLIHIYGGPESNTVKLLPPNGLTEKFLNDMPNLVSIEIDGAGTYGRGSKNRFKVYTNLGLYESNDVVEVIKFYVKNKNIDATKICIWGWSYGGFMALTTVSRHTDIINCAIAVAPVTDWYFYDAFYTERYMGPMTENSSNYHSTSIIQNVKNLTGSHLFIAHGLDDDNVNPVNSIILLDLLKKEHIDVSYYLMSGQNHNVENRTVFQNLYNNMVQFMKERLQ